MKEKLKAYLCKEKAELKSGITSAEYVWWWTLRLCMIGMITYNVLREREQMVIFIMCANFLLTFIIPLMRLVFFKKIFLGKLPYRIQSFIDVFIFAGSFLGHGLDYNGTVPDYDKLMHFISGGLAVFIGYLIMQSVKGGKELSPALKTIGAGGFSCVVIVVWEIFEFFSDFIIDGSANQNWMYEPDGTFVFYRIFGMGAGKTEQYTVLDTDLDIFVAAVGACLCMAILYALLKRKERVFARLQKTTG